MSDDIRAKYWLEATAHIAEANRHVITEPEFWAATISALVNATMAGAPDSVMYNVDRILHQQRTEAKLMQSHIQKRVKEDLQPCNKK